VKRLLVVVAALALVAGGFLLGRRGAGVGGWAQAIEEVPVGGLSRPSDLDLPELDDGPVQSVVLMVADGLGLSQTTAAAIRAFGPGGRFLFERFPVVGLVSTHPEGGIVTSSDAAATSIATGRKTKVGRIGESGEGDRLTSILEAMRAAGSPAGLITSERIYDATPAAFAAHVDRRRDYPRVVAALADSGVELLAGGGVDQFRPPAAESDLLAAAEGRGVHVVRTVEEWERADALPLWALFPGAKVGESAGTPLLSALTARGVELLAAEAARRGTGFFLMVEEEGPDTSGHANEIDGVAAAVLRFDRAVEAAARFAAADGRTLVLVLADHATGGPTVHYTSTAERLSVSWASGHHTGERVPLYAYGPPAAARRFAGTLDNTEIAPRLAGLLGVTLDEPAEEN